MTTGLLLWTIKPYQNKGVGEREWEPFLLLPVMRWFSLEHSQAYEHSQAMLLTDSIFSIRDPPLNGAEFRLIKSSFPIEGSH